MYTLEVPEEKSYVEWQLRVRRISMFTTQPNDLQARAGGIRSVERLKSNSDDPNLKKDALLLVNGNPAAANRLAYPTTTQDRSLLTTKTEDNRPALSDRAEDERAAAKIEDKPDSKVMLQPEPINLRGDEKRKSFYKNKTNSFKPILKQKTLRSQNSTDKNRSTTTDKKVKFNKTKSVLKYNPHAGIGRRKSLKA